MCLYLVKFIMFLILYSYMFKLIKSFFDYLLNDFKETYQLGLAEYELAEERAKKKKKKRKSRFKRIKNPPKVLRKYSNPTNDQIKIYTLKIKNKVYRIKTGEGYDEYFCKNISKKRK